MRKVLYVLGKIKISFNGIRTPDLPARILIPTILAQLLLFHIIWMKYCQAEGYVSKIHSVNVKWNKSFLIILKRIQDIIVQ
jgi:hypothetical protein